MARFQKGTSGNPKGKPKGTPNKRTKEANEILDRALLELSGTLEQDVNAVNASRRLQLLTDLFNYSKPKLSSNKIEADIKQDTNTTIVIRHIDRNGDVK